MSDRYAQCDDTCTVDCGHCKGAGRPADVTREPTGGQELREAMARYMFERSETWRDLCSPEDADWGEWVERNREEWRQEADALIAGPLAALLADADNWRRATTGDPTQPEPLAMQARTLLARVRDLEAQVGRVRELLPRITGVMEFDMAGERYDAVSSVQQVRDHLRRALDPEPQP